MINFVLAEHAQIYSTNSVRVFKTQTNPNSACKENRIREFSIQNQDLRHGTTSNFPVATRYETKKTGVGVRYVSSNQDA